MKGLKLIAVAVVATTASLANADASYMKPSSVSAEIGTLGYGAKVAWDVNDKTQLQVGINGGDVVDMIPCDCVKDRRVDDVRFKMSSSFGTPYVGVQVRPMNNALTVGAGVMHIGNNKVHAYSVPTGSDRKIVVGENDNQYTIKGDAKIEADIKFKNQLAPYLTVGVHPNSKKRVSMFGEVGAMYVNGAKTDVTVSGKFEKDGQEFTAQDSDEVAQLKDDIRHEWDRRVKKNVRNKDSFYPIAKVGATVRF